MRLFSFVIFHDRLVFRSSCSLSIALASSHPRSPSEDIPRPPPGPSLHLDLRGKHSFSSLGLSVDACPSSFARWSFVTPLLVLSAESVAILFCFPLPPRVVLWLDPAWFRLFDSLGEFDRNSPESYSAWGFFILASIRCCPCNSSVEAVFSLSPFVGPILRPQDSHSRICTLFCDTRSNH